MRIATVMPSSTVAAEYWGLVGTVSDERFTQTFRRNSAGDPVEVEMEPEAVIEFEQNDDFKLRDIARGSPSLCKSLQLPVSALLFAETKPPSIAGWSCKLLQRLFTATRNPIVT